MHIISHRAIIDFAQIHPNAAAALDTWYRTMKKATFQNVVELHAVFPTADLVGRVFVFNIGGNSVRLITAIHFDRQKVYILDILTHAEYDKDKWKD
jgi:mRNA interferase HigB